MVALEHTETNWTVISNEGQQSLVSSRGAKVFGVLLEGVRSGLIALEDDLQTVTLNGSDWRKEMFRAHAPVEHIVLCQRPRHIAYSTVYGEIVVYSPWHNADVCRYRPEGGK